MQHLEKHSNLGQLFGLTKRDEAHRDGLNVVQGNFKQNTTSQTLPEKN